MPTERTDSTQPDTVPRAPRGYANVVIGGVLFERLKVQVAAHNGRCHRSGTLFSAGATIGFLDRDTLTPEQQRAVFGDRPPKHLTVLLTPDEANPPPEPPLVLPEPPEVVRCHPDPARLEPFRDLIAFNEYPSNPSFSAGGSRADEWGVGNVWTRAVAYSCGRLTRDDTTLDHRHDPAELALCVRIANETVSRLARLEVGEGGPIKPFFAVAIVGSPVTREIDESVVRGAFGGTLAPGLNFRADRMVRRAGHWNRLEGAWIPLDSMPAEVLSGGDIDGYLAAAWDEFAEWFVGVPGLREHTVVGIGYSDGDPGIMKPRLLLALTAAGSLVGVISYVTHG